MRTESRARRGPPGPGRRGAPRGESGRAGDLGRFARATLAALLVAVACLSAEPGGAQAPAAAGAEPVGAPPGAGTSVGYARIEGVIDRLRHRYLERVLERARAEKVARLVVHIDTDGGEVFYAREMLKRLLEQARDGPRLVAFVDFRAISAGAMLAYGHEAIYLTDAATIGDIGVVFAKPGGGIEYAPEKIETVVRALLKQAAETRGWSKGLLLKMTARNQELYRITRPGGERVFVIEDDLPEYLASHPDVDRDDPQQVILYRGKDRLLTMTGREAVDLGMATGLVNDLSALYDELGVDATRVVDLAPSASEALASMVAGFAPLLAGLALMFVFFELKTPGVGIWAALGGVCAVLFLIAQYALDLANNIEVVLIAAGLAAVLVEVLTMVSGGLLAILGALLALAGLTMAFVPNEFEFDPSDGRYLSALADAATSTLVAVGVLAVGLVAAIFLLPRSPMLGRLANRAEVTATSRSRRPSAASRLVGMRGVAAERLSPAGVVIVAGESRTASTEHGVFVEEGTEVVVVRAAFGELVVRPLADGGPSEGRDG